VGGDINLEGATLKTAGGHIELGSVGDNSLVSLTPINKGFALGYDGVQNFGNIKLSQQAAVDASGPSGGGIQVRGKRITLTDGSQIEASTLGADKGGSLVVNATESVEVSGTTANQHFPSGFYVEAYPGATGEAGELRINTGELLIKNGGQANTITFGPGKGGSLTVNAKRVQLIGRSDNGKFPSGLLASSEPPPSGQVPTGDAGKVTITTDELLIQDGAEVSAATWGAGKGGSLTVNAKRVQLIGLGSPLGTGNCPANPFCPSGLFTYARRNTTGDAGDLTIHTEQLLVRDGAHISVYTSGAGKGGSLTVKAKRVQLIGNRTCDSLYCLSGLFAYTGQYGTGDAGEVLIKTGELLIQDGAVVNASTSNRGKGGNLTVNAERVQLIGISPPIQFDDVVGLIGMLPNDIIPSSLFTSNVSNNVSSATGNAGNLTINTGQLLVQDGAAISVMAFGEGNAGNLIINARSILLDKGTLIANTRSNSTDPNKEQATITLRSRDLILRRGSNITTEAKRTATGGNITIDTGILAASENSDISANAEASGGRIKIDAQGIFGTQFRNKNTPESDITATSALGPEFSGTVNINAPDVDLSRGLINLPSVPIDTELAQGCNSPNYAQSSFIITGRGGLPPNPKDILTPDAVQVDWVTLNPELDKNSSTNISTNPNTTTPAPIVEATGWVFGPKGEVIFTAQVPTQHQNSWQTPSKCHEK
jgi:large exoprotein involved in heme utilization and adhesion